jgi:hypothetical protein
MTTIEKVIDNLTKVIFDVEESDHGDSGWQWYYGTLIQQGIEYPFSICVMHDSNSGTESYELTFTEELPFEMEQMEEKILAEFDWSEINDEHEQNEIGQEKTMQKIRNENF